MRARLRKHWAETLAFALALACTAALLGRLCWIFELFTHFRIQYLVLGAGTLLMLALKRRWLAVFALAPLLVSAAWPLAPYLMPRAEVHGTTGTELTIMSFNVFASNHAHAALLALVHSQAPDVLVLTEVTRRWAAALEPLHERYPYRLLEPRRRGGDGIAVLSRLPVRQARIVPLLSMPAVTLVLDVAGRDVQLLGVHLRSPPGARAVAERNRQLEALAALVVAGDGPRIVTGDFNSSPFSPFLADWLVTTGLVDAARGRGYVYTWPSFLPILGIPLDHCFVSEDFEVLEHRRLPAIGSDHHPIFVRLALSAG